MIDEPNTTLESVTTPPISDAHTQASDEIAPQILELIEIPAAPERPLLTTPLNDYTVAEGLLLLMFVLLLVKSFIALVKTSYEKSIAKSKDRRKKSRRQTPPVEVR